MSMLDDLKAYLESAVVVGGSTGWEVVFNLSPPSPDQVLVITDTGGTEGDADEGPQYDYPSFQILGRAGSFDYGALRAKLQEVYEALHDQSVTGFIYVFGSQSAPLSLGLDGNDRPLLAWNFRGMRTRGN